MLHTDRPERTTPGAVLRAGDRTLVVASARPHQGRWLVRFEGITDRNGAEEPEAVEIDVEERRDDVQLLVHASPSDMGRLIGKRGRVIQALRQVVRAAGAAEGIKANVDVVE